MNVITLPRCSIAYLRRTGVYGAENRAVMERLLALAGQAGLLGPEAVILSIAWDDPALGIDWHLAPGDVVLSPKDSCHPRLEEAAELFDYNTDYYA